MTSKNQLTGFEIAVIGMAGRFPGAKNIHEFWENLKNGVESVAFFTDEELKETVVEPELLKNPNFVKSDSILDDIEYFDASFFEYTPKEAEILDPQVRIFHECAWEALEDAGYNSELFDGLIGLYAGASTGLYWQALTISGGKTRETGVWATGLLMDKDFLCLRVAYKLNLKGPSCSIKTACSTSLVAIHVACQAILNGECDMALAGGVTISLPNKAGYLFQEGTIKSRDGHCRAFDSRGEGTISGDGVGIVVLKRLEDALIDKDNIYAVIKGSAINNDGIRKVGFTAPSIEGQAEVIKIAHQMAHIEPESIGYIETHGTGTPLGDSVEIEGLKLAFNTNKRGFCPIGSVKTNIGHLDSAAGVAGFIKTVLSLKHRLIPPSLHFETPNAKIDFENSPIYVNEKLKEWNNNGCPLRAGISSFGIGGTNAHIVLEEAPTNSRENSPAAGDSNANKNSEYHFILLSALTQTALDMMTQNFVSHLKRNPGIDLGDAAYTLQVGRKDFKYRRMTAGATSGEIVKHLSSHGSRSLHTFVVKDEKPPVIFMFSGLGSQYVNMGLDLYQKEIVFRQEMDRCFEILKPLLGYDVKEILYPYPDGKDGSEPPLPRSCSQPDRINQPAVTQTVVFSFEYALAKLLMHWGAKPHTMIGYSFGEYTAACISGIFSLEDVLKLIVSRGKLIAKIPDGAMLSVPLRAEELKSLLNDHVSLAIDNGPSCIAAGSIDAIREFEKQMKEKKLMCMRLNTSHAIHSTMMEPILKEFEEIIKKFDLNEPQIPYISNVTGKRIKVEEVTRPSYWVSHLRHTVLFAKGIKELTVIPNSIFVEIGPGRDLTVLLARHLEEEAGQTVINLTRPPEKQIPDTRYFLDKIVRLWLRGIDINKSGFYPGEKRHRVSLPTYPFEGERYWIDDSDLQLNADMVPWENQPANRKKDMADCFYIPQWTRSVLLGSINRGILKQSPLLVFANNTHLALQMVEEMKCDGLDVTVVMQSIEFRKLSDREFSINPREPGAYEILFKELTNLGRYPSNIIHLWGLTNAPGTALESDCFDDAQYLGYYSLVYLVKAIAKQNAGTGLRLEVVTNHLYEVTGEEELSPEKMTVLGPVKVIPQEYPFVVCRSLDVILPEPGSRQEKKLIRQLLNEFAAKAGDTVVAYRGNYRWVLEYKPLRLEKTGEHIPQLKKRGVYLITGGLGNFGLMLSRFLVGHLQASVVLTGRSFPPRDEWETWLADHPEQDSVSRKIKAILEMELKGGEVMVCKADVASRQEMEQVIRQTEKRFGRINGVVHAAGQTTGKSISCPLEQLGMEEYQQQSRPKIHGLLILKELLKEKEPDFCLLTSSLSPILGGLGLTAYSAVNSFMDGFVYKHNREEDIRWLSVNWEGWPIGEKRTQLQSAVGAGEINWIMTPDEVIEAFQRVLYHYQSNQIIVTPGDLQTRINKWIKLEFLREEPGPLKRESPSLGSRPYLSGEYLAPRIETEKKLVRIWQDLLGYEQPGIRDDFFELGGDSLTAVMLTSKIHKEFHVNISLSEIFERPTIKDLAQYIKEASPERFAAIEPVEQKEYYQLSSGQKRLYILDVLDDKSIGYNLSLTFLLEGCPDNKRFENAFKCLIKRHEILRTSFEMIEGVPVQRIHEDVEFAIEYYQVEVKAKVEEERTSRFEGTRGLAPLPGAPLSVEPAAPNPQPVTALIRSFIRPFDLSCAPLLRVCLIKEADQKHILLVDMHHIIWDGISTNILMKEFMSFYMGKEFPHPRIHYKDFAEWQNSKEAKEFIVGQEDYWLKEYQGEIPVLNLPTDFARPAVQSFEGRTFSFEINKQDTIILKKYALDEGATLFMILLAVFNILLSKISGQEDIVVGTALAGRRHKDVETIIGFFLNTLALRNYPIGEKTFKEFFIDVKKRTLKAFENQDYPFENLVEKVVLERDITRNPLYSVMLILQNFNTQQDLLPELESGGLRFTPYAYEGNVSTNDLTLYVVEREEKLCFSLEYCTKLFKSETIERFVGCFNKIISSLLYSTDRKILEIEIISADEKRKILFEFNNTKRKVVRDKCYHQLWEESVIKNSDRIAAIHNTWQTTYKKLNEDADYIAYFLVEHGIEPCSVIALYMTRGIHMLASIIGVFKAGCAYLPLEMEYPEERIKTILQDCEVKLLVSESWNSEKINRIMDTLPNLETLLYLDKRDSSQGVPGGCPVISLQPSQDNLAYVIYTSGTTGKPKGVMIQQKGMLNHLDAKINDLSLGPDDIIAQTASACFDISVWQFLVGLLLGARTFIIDKEIVIEPTKFLRVLQEGNITILEAVPSLTTAFLKVVKNEKDSELRHLRWMVLTGEALGVHLVRDWYDQYPGIKILNAYGPTEASDDITHYVIDEIPRENQETIPIGKPLQNLHIYILDKNLRLCPIGVRGEICVAGIGVGKGYCKDPEKTKNLFNHNPYSEDIGDSDYKILYRTGDIGYFREDGNIECLGRLDHQVKIRGNRIELGEIETQLLNHEDIKETVVTVVAPGGDGTSSSSAEGKYICAYYTAEKEINITDLWKYLSSELPDYMVPSFFVPLESIPLTPNGKVDRKALPAPEINADDVYTAPASEEEKKLVEIWAEILGLKKNIIGVTANFFELGGHSLKATLLVAKIQKMFHVKLPLAEIFKTPTIRELSKFIKKAAEDKYTAIEIAEKKEYYELSSAQKRLFILHQMNPDSTAYNMPEIIPLSAGFDLEKLEETFKKLIKRHESLRTSFHMVNDTPVQVVHDEVESQVENYTMQIQRYCENGEIGERENVIIKEFVRPFALSMVPLLRIGLVNNSDGNNTLLVDMHHIISDGVSLEILAKDFLAIHEGEELPTLRVQYKDFSQWQEVEKEKKNFKLQEEYWLKQFLGEVPVINLPRDYPGPGVQNFEGGVVHFEMDAGKARALKDLAMKENVTLYILMIAICYVFLAKISGQEDIVMGTDVANRRHTDLENIIGMFVNTLALRNYPNGDKYFKKFLQEVKISTLEAFENQEYPFEDLVDRLVVNRDAGRNPLFDVMFSFWDVQNAIEKIPSDENSQLRVKPYESEHRTAKFDLMLFIIESAEHMVLLFEYCTKLFKETTIKEFISYFNKIVGAVLEEPGIKILEIEIVSDEEEKKLLKAIRPGKEEEFQKNKEKPGKFTVTSEAEFDF